MQQSACLITRYLPFFTAFSEIFKNFRNISRANERVSAVNGVNHQHFPHRRPVGWNQPGASTSHSPVPPAPRQRSAARTRQSWGSTRDSACTSPAPQGKAGIVQFPNLQAVHGPCLGEWRKSSFTCPQPSPLPVLAAKPQVQMLWKTGKNHPRYFPGKPQRSPLPQHSTLIFYCRQNTATSRAQVNPEVFRRARYGSSVQSVKSWWRKGKAKRNRWTHRARE